MQTRPRFPHPTGTRARALSVIVISVLAACALGLASSAAHPPAQGGATAAEAREVEDTIPAHLPIKVRVRNPEKVKDLRNENWLGDLEVEVTNTGTKPIYLIILSLHLPDVKGKAAGSIVGFQLWHGRAELGDFNAPLQAEDVPIRPGESCILKVPESKVKGWELYKAEKNLPNPRRIKLNILLINFGDGTGFTGPDGVPREGEGQKRANAGCREGAVTAAGAGDRPMITRSPDSPPEHLFLPLPVSFLPAIFSTAKLIPASGTMLTQTCCPGTSSDCFSRKEQTNNCSCGPVLVATSASCSESGSRCATAVFVEESCTDSNGHILSCDHYELGTSCAAPTPTVTPGAALAPG